MAALIDSGDARFEYRHRIVTGTDALRAAEASECAADQGYFWAYHGVLMSNQKGQGSFTYDRLKGFAQELGLDTKSFNQCVDERTHKSTVEKANNEATKLGVTGTPTFTLNGKFIQVQQSFNEVVTAVKQEVSK